MTVTFTNNAVKVLEARYLQRDVNSGELVETPVDMLHRVAHHIASAEPTKASQDIWEANFEAMMSDFDFLPNSPTLANAGGPLGQLSACFVLPVPDSMDGIFTTVHDMAMIHKSGGGTGFSFTNVRGKGLPVRQTHGVASGPIPFMRVFNEASEVVRQGGMRHGANMGIIHWRHPDILDFIHMKDTVGEMVNFNISVGADADFFRLIDAGDHDAIAIWQNIINCAWATGDPGLVFLDRINSGKSNPVPSFGPIEATNPCGEQPLYPYDSCNLGSINLANMVAKNGHTLIDYKKLGRTVSTAVRFLDNVVTVNKYPHPEITRVSNAIRRIGLGVMGWADMLYKLEIPYDSQLAVVTAKQIMQRIQEEADAASEALGHERGSFPAYDESIYRTGGPMRNSTRTTIAPTGTISILAGCSSGIEPNFGLAFKRQHRLDRADGSRNVEMFEVNPVFQQKIGPNPSTLELLAQGTPFRTIVQNGIDSRHFSPEVLSVYKTAHEIEPSAHLAMQAAFQRYTDNAVSKTINFPRSATVADIAKAYREAWDSGCMGITVYRDGCRDAADQVLGFATTTANAVTVAIPTPAKEERRKLPRERQSITKKFRVAEWDGYIICGLYEDGTLGEVFLQMDRMGDTVTNALDATMMAVSIGLQYNVPLETYVRKYRGGRFEPSGLTDDADIRTCSSLLDFIFRWLEIKFLKPERGLVVAVNGEVVSDHAERVTIAAGPGCPQCDAPLIREEGCERCSQCPYSRC